ncbi:MAG TPA: chemotaxis protein CheW [bacterium]|nr:chemotaxis protein CheW [bacterium]
MMKTQEKSLGELLRQAGKITSRQIQVALEDQKKSHEPIGKVLVRLGFVEDQDILQVMQGMMVLTFRLGKELYGIETFRIREVLKILPFQLADDPKGFWEGTVELRGMPLPVLSFRKFLGLEPGSKTEKSWLIVLEKKGSPFILWVDEVLEVTRLKIDQIEPCPAYLFGKKNDLYYCLGKVKDDLYSILNPDKLTGEQDLLPPTPEVNFAFPP